MSFLSEIEFQIAEALKEKGYNIDKIKLVYNATSEFGEYQINVAFKLAKALGKSPLKIAEELANIIRHFTYFSEVSVSTPGFINLKLNSGAVMNYFNNLHTDFTAHIDKQASKTILLDYGGPNASKALHVGHMRSANIGEAIKRLCQTLGHKTIGDIHLGDNGLPTGIVLMEMEQLHPNLEFFELKDKYPKKTPFTVEDLQTIYPNGVKKAALDEKLMARALELSALLQDGHPGLTLLWRDYLDLSLQEIKAVYKLLNVDFDLWETETDSFAYFDQMRQIIDKSGVARISDGALVVDVTEATDKKELPPFIIFKSDGTAMYSTTDLATHTGRIERFKIDEVWYFTDKRQSLHFKQLFRTIQKLPFDYQPVLSHTGFGTMNDKDGKPFKTRDGDPLPLMDCYNLVKDYITPRLSDKIAKKNRETIAKQITTAVIKYADLLPTCTTDYVFDLESLADTEGKTGPYMLYTSVRIKSLLKKAKEHDIKSKQIIKLSDNGSDYDVLFNLLSLPVVLTNSYNNKSLNEICEYLYKLNASYNKFYNECNVLNEIDPYLQESWLMIASLVLKANELLLDILAIEIPEEM